MEKLRIVHLNAACNSTQNLTFNYGNSADRIWLLVEPYLDCDIISICEISSYVLYKLQARLIKEGYQPFVIDSAWGNVKESNRFMYKVLTALFVRNKISYRQLFYKNNAFSTTLRYAMISISLKDTEIVLKSAHIPCVIDNKEKRKKAMLKEELRLQRLCIQDSIPAIYVGDYNGTANAAKDTYCCQDLFDMLPFNDLVRESTFKDRQLDHVYISPKAEHILNIDVGIIKDSSIVGVLTDHTPLYVTALKQ